MEANLRWRSLEHGSEANLRRGAQQEEVWGGKEGPIGWETLSGAIIIINSNNDSKNQH